MIKHFRKNEYSWSSQDSTTFQLKLSTLKVSTYINILMTPSLLVSKIQFSIPERPSADQSREIFDNFFPKSIGESWGDIQMSLQ